ncbi:phage antirepressor KilAC domain-containing protein [Staphylococcus aureus]|uniref:phage antirepressor KilAC domain-containing protein n=1 Tax=Staphylococcus aureus TaxID=1280 RepID=UPI00397F1A0B
MKNGDYIENRRNRLLENHKGLKSDLEKAKNQKFEYDGHTSISKTPKVTGKGQQYFVNKFLGEK